MLDQPALELYLLLTKYKMVDREYMTSEGTQDFERCKAFKTLGVVTMRKVNRGMWATQLKALPYVQVAGRAYRPHSGSNAIETKARGITARTVWDAMCGRMRGKLVNV